MKCDVLNLEWTSYPSRDRQMATLVCNYLRFMGYNVIEGSVFNGYYLLNKLKPKVFFICDTRGADINLNLMKYAKTKGMYGISLISEGNFSADEEILSLMIWGWNRDKVLYEDIHLQWTEGTRRRTLSHHPELKSRIRVSGGVGFDIYKIVNSLNRYELLIKYSKNNYKKAIGVGCCDFGVFYPEDPRYTTCRSLYSRSVRERFIKDQNDFNNVLKFIILQNPEIVFIVKEHPGCIGGGKASAIEGLEHMPNVLILKNEESIADCISISDFWIVYESTTALEAWLLGKQTCLLNPSGTDFPRANVYQGSPNFPSKVTLQDAIDHFYENGELPGFMELESYRNKIIKDTIQWDDGLNHVRAGNEIIDLLQNWKVRPCGHEPLHLRMTRLTQQVKWRVSPFIPFVGRFRVYAQHRKNFDPGEISQLSTTRMGEQVKFYRKAGLTKNDLKAIRCI